MNKSGWQWSFLVAIYIKRTSKGYKIHELIIKWKLRWKVTKLSIYAFGTNYFFC
jgi:hypothetical protein